MNSVLNYIQKLWPKINGLRPIINCSFLQGFQMPETLGHIPLILGCTFLADPPLVGSALDLHLSVCLCVCVCVRHQLTKLLISFILDEISL